MLKGICIVFVFLAAVTANQKELKRILSVNSASDQKNKTAYNASGTVTKCNTEMMTAYGMQGYETAQSALHQHCPMITRNCCTPEDEQTSMKLWNNEHKFLIERYYEVYLYSVKFILGYSEEVYKIAKGLETSENEQCRESAIDYLSMNFNPKITKDIYKSYVHALEKLGDLRRGFYCILCDATTQDRLRDYWSSTNLFYNDRVYFSTNFCRKLVEHTIKSSYFTVFYLKRFAENMVNLMNCKTGATVALEYETPFWVKQSVKNCHYFKNDYFFFFCERYCEGYQITKPNSIFDGDLGELKKFVDHLIQYRHQAFVDPDNNILAYGVGFEEDYLKYNYEEAMKEIVFFRASTNQVNLDKFQTDVLYFGGMDPWESVENSLYELALAYVGLVRVVTMLILMAVWF